MPLWLQLQVPAPIGIPITRLSNCQLIISESCRDRSISSPALSTSKLPHTSLRSGFYQRHTHTVTHSLNLAPYCDHTLPWQPLQFLSKETSYAPDVSDQLANIENDINRTQHRLLLLLQVLNCCHRENFLLAISDNLPSLHR